MGEIITQEINNAPAIKDEKDILSVLIDKGMTSDYIADRLKELFDWEEVKVDKNGNAYKTSDGNLRLKAIELYLKLLKPSKGGTSNHLHVSEATLNKLLGQK